MSVKPSYFAVLPAVVRYDKTLAPAARLFYAELTALANQEGYCFAHNKYLMDLFEVDSRTLRRWMTALEERKYIFRKTVDNRRRIYIAKGRAETPRGGENVRGVGQKSPRKASDSLYRFNNTSIKEGDRVVLPWNTEAFAESWKKWITYKKEEHGERYKSAKTEQQALMRLQKITDDSEAAAIEAIDHSIANQYKGIYTQNGTRKETSRDSLADALRRRRGS